MAFLGGLFGNKGRAERFDDGRYRIVDEPKRLPLGGLSQLMLLIMLPITLYCALTINLLFFFLPGVWGMLIGGRHMWLDPLLCLAAIVTFVATAVINFVALESEWIGEVGYDYAQSLGIALTALPLFLLIQMQHRTLTLRAALSQ